MLEKNKGLVICQSSSMIDLSFKGIKGLMNLIKWYPADLAQ